VGAAGRLFNRFVRSAVPLLTDTPTSLRLEQLLDMDKSLRYCTEVHRRKNGDDSDAAE
jgi:hypothetical protein